MLTKAQHAWRYRSVPKILRALREDCGFTQRELGKKLRRPQSWVYNCETGNRRVDIAEFCEWCEACAVDPLKILKSFLRSR